ncbi:MAG: hypothetical protein KAS12_06205, partial [Candidatus Aenigmarchaeota archaeon]|nr:hypothetical protein [Candidatus Aenigmarchaeota archaeon]
MGLKALGRNNIMPIITLGLNSNETTGKNHVFEYWTKISEKYKLNIEMANKTIILTASVNQTFSGGFIYPPESNGSNEIYFLAPLDYSKENLFAHGILPDGITQCKTITGDIPYHDTDENETTLKVKDY